MGSGERWEWEPKVRQWWFSGPRNEEPIRQSGRGELTFPDPFDVADVFVALILPPVENSPCIFAYSGSVIAFGIQDRKQFVIECKLCQRSEEEIRAEQIVTCSTCDFSAPALSAAHTSA